MAFCSHCGAQLTNGAKFCSECGAPVDTINQTNHHRKTVYDGVIHKCPNCGEILKSFEINCPSCGYELRGSKASSAVKEFELRFERAQNINEKIDLVKTFIIPNTKEDILEFMILAVSNISPRLYENQKGNSKEIRLSFAWETKYEQAYQKAKKLFPNVNEIEQYQNIVLEKKRQIESIKKEHKRIRGKEKARQRRASFLRENPEWVLLLCSVIALILWGASLSIPHAIKEYNLERLVEDVETLIEEGDFETARIKANQIIDDSGWSTDSEEKWDSIRESLVESIDEQEAAALGKIQIEISYDELEKMDFQEAESYLAKKGFTNIKLEPISDLITGWITKNGEIEEISIGSRSNFSEDDYFLPDVEIIISYHTFK